MQVPISKKRLISNKVAYILQKCRNRDPFFVARKLGIEYRLINFNNDLLAFSEKSSSNDKGTIYINSNLGTYARKILCAHELAHLLLHVNDDYNLFGDIDIDPLKEYEANYFAALLLPQIIAHTNISEMSVETFNDYILHKINKLNRIS